MAQERAITILDSDEDDGDAQPTVPDKPPAHLHAHASAAWHRPHAPRRLLDLPHDFLELLVQAHVMTADVASVRASCRTLKAVGDRRLGRLVLPYGQLCAHSFWRTCPLPAVRSMVLELPAPSATPAAAPAPSSIVVAGRAPAQQSAQRQIAQQQQHSPHPPQQQQQQQHAAAPLSALLPPVALAGLRRHLPYLSHLTLRHALLTPLPPSPSSSSASPASATGGEPGCAAPLPLDLRGLSRLSLECAPPPPPRSWRGSGCNVFPGGLGPALLAAAAADAVASATAGGGLAGGAARASTGYGGGSSGGGGGAGRGGGQEGEGGGGACLAALHVSHATFEAAGAELLGRLTGLRELSIRCSNNFGLVGLSSIGLLSRLTRLAFADVHYRVGIPNEMVALSRLSCLASACFQRCDFFPREVAAWAAWGPTLTRLEFSSRWQMTVDALPPLLPALTALRRLDLPDHELDEPLWATLTDRLTSLSAARFGWVHLDAAADHEQGRGHVQGQAAAAGGAGQGAGGQVGGGVAAGAPERAGGGPPPLLTHKSLRVLVLDAPYDEAECGRSLRSLMPSLEELSVGEALGVIGSEDPRVVDRTDRWPNVARWMQPGPAPAASAAWPLTSLTIPHSWMASWMPAALPQLRRLRLLQSPPPFPRARPTLLPVPASAAAASPERVHAEARRRVEWRATACTTGGGSSTAAAPARWEALQELEVPSDLDLTAVHVLCPAVRSVTVSSEYGDALLALALAPDQWATAAAGSYTPAPGRVARRQAASADHQARGRRTAPAGQRQQAQQSGSLGRLPGQQTVQQPGLGGPLPFWRELTLHGTLRVGQDAEAYHGELLTALAGRSVRVVRVTQGSGVSHRWWVTWRQGSAGSGSAAASPLQVEVLGAGDLEAAALGSEGPWILGSRMRN